MTELGPILKVGFRDYAVESWDPIDAANQTRYGDSRHHSGARVRIDESHGDQEAGSTLLHEALHCVAKVWELGQSHDEEERIVACLSNGLATVLRDNPWVLDYLTKKLGGKA